MTDNDLGFGKVVTEQAEGRLVNKDGTPNTRKYGQGPQSWQRLYLRILGATWPSLIGWTLGLILLTAGVFAVGYRALGPAALSGSERLGLTDPFFASFAYSVAILTGVGAGPVVAVGSSAQWLTILESIAGLMALGLGGGLTLALMLAARERGLPLPACGWCISPWVDLDCGSASLETKAAVDPMIQKPYLQELAAAYLGGTPSRTALAAPLYADLRGLPPLLIQVGSAETLLDDSVLLAGVAGAADVRVTLEIWPEMIHAWPLFHQQLAAGRKAIAHAAAFIRAAQGS